MNKNIRTIGFVIFLGMLFSACLHASNLVLTRGLTRQDSFGAPIQDNLASAPVAQNNTVNYAPARGLTRQSSFRASIIEGNADRLIKAMGEDPEKLVDYPVDKSAYVWNSPYKKSVLTANQLAKKQEDRENAAFNFYGNDKSFKNFNERIQSLEADIQALQDKQKACKVADLKQDLDKLLIVARNVDDALQEAELNKRVDDLLQGFMPSISNNMLLSDGLQNAQQGLHLAYQLKDELSAAAHKKAVAWLEKVGKEMIALQKGNSLQQAIALVNTKLANLEKSNNISGNNFLDEQIHFYKDVAAALQAEARVESKEITKYEKDLSDAKSKAKSMLVADSAREALIKAKEDLVRVESSVHKYMNKIELQYKEAEIKKLHKVIELLEIELKKEQEDESRQDKKVNELVDKLLVKHNSNSSKALTEALLDLYGNSSTSWLGSWVSGQPSAELKIKEIKDKKAKNSKLSEKEKIVLQLDQRLQNEKMSDPLNIALAQLGKSSTGDVPQALQNVIGAALGKVGITVDRLDVTVREQLAVDLKFTSDELIKVMQSPTLSEQQKQLQKQIIVKAMLERNSHLLASGVTGASVEALKTGNAQTIATDIALNKVINTLVPTQPSQIPGFDLSAMNM